MHKITFFLLVGCLIGMAFAALPPPDCLQGSIPSSKDPFVDCCKVTVFPNDVLIRCKNSYPTTPPAPNAPIKGCCLAECVMNDTKILVNGSINKQVAITYLTNQVGSDEESRKIVINAVEFCSSQDMLMKKDFDNLAQQPQNSPTKVCSLFSAYFVGCVSANIYRTCPKSKYTAGDAECDKIKTFAERCNILWPKKQLI